MNIKGHSIKRAKKRPGRASSIKRHKKPKTMDGGYNDPKRTNINKRFEELITVLGRIRPYLNDNIKTSVNKMIDEIKVKINNSTETVNDDDNKYFEGEKKYIAQILIDETMLLTPIPSGLNEKDRKVKFDTVGKAFTAVLEIISKTSSDILRVAAAAPIKFEPILPDADYKY